jgi:hypothetical protein
MGFVERSASWLGGGAKRAGRSMGLANERTPRRRSGARKSGRGRAAGKKR